MTEEQKLLNSIEIDKILGLDDIVKPELNIDLNYEQDYLKRLNKLMDENFINPLLVKIEED